LSPAAAFPHVGIGLLGVALTFGLVLGGRHPAKEMLPYWIVQVLGGIVAAWVLVFIVGGNGTDPLA
jgi:aquaporin Z